MYVGPFLVTRVIEPVNYVIQRSAKTKPIVVHVDKLKKCYGDTPNSWLNIHTITEEGNGTTHENTALAPESETVKSKRRESMNKKDDFEEQETAVTDAANQRPKRQIRKAPAFFRDYQC